jgi:AAA+ superfamily predicted ATPase
MQPFETSLQHILAELERIDLLVQAQVGRARQLYGGDEQFQGLVITEQEVDALLANPSGLPYWAAETMPRTLPDVAEALEGMAAAIERRRAASAQRGVPLRLSRLSELFDLTPFDREALLVCLAPELDLRYERLYAYLQDDVTKKRPSVDLVLNLLCPAMTAKLALRQRFVETAPLIEHGLLRLFDDPTHLHPPLLSKFLKVDERIVRYLLDQDDVDPRLLPYARCGAAQASLGQLLLPEGMTHRLAGLVRQHGAAARRLILYLQGPYGVGKESVAGALCREQGLGLLVVDGERLLQAEDLAFETAVQLAVREARLQGAALYWDGFDALLADERRAWRAILWKALAGPKGLVFLAGDGAWEPVDDQGDVTFLRVEFERPDYGQRIQLWSRCLNGDAEPTGELDLGALASRFRFSGGQIRDAAATARSLARWRDPGNGQVSAEDLYAACRLQSNRKLAALARKITPHYTWSDIVLPADRMQLLREICNQVRYRALVYGAWGFDRKLALGKGLNVLFAGPSGTGKTMAAEIMAGELGLDLYKIDLATVVSKYIGETEKNLARIFAEAETSNAILFFDEADALFGKRSEVRDSHDRYANIEISYLLQRMEEYDGMAILATNLHKNMDEAFVRRMHFTVEFPFPDAGDRRRIWEKIWPAETPRAAALDLGLMARRFEIAGGSIRNIALAAAFLAADNGQCVDMAHLMAATRREYQKMGKVVADEYPSLYGAG